jgi:16S rRNA (guanine1207-N2)-methyltransferase
MRDFSYESLRRWPDVEAENLVAADATDRLITDESAAAVRANPDGVVVIGDHFGALTLAALAINGATDVRVHQDSLTAESALTNNAQALGLDGRFRSLGLDPDLVRGARVVLMQLPKSLAELQEISELVAAHAHPEVVVYAGGRVKHMTTSMNDVLRGSFREVTATLARQKSRVVVARDPRAEVTASFPRREHHDDLDLWVSAHGGVFSGTKIDIGTRFLLGFVARMSPRASAAVDLGCGTGVLAVALARSHPTLSILATDDSAAAVASAAETIEANDVADRIAVRRDDAMSAVPAASVDLVVCNPPYHLGTTVHVGVADRLFHGASRVLRPGGELWTVFNTPLAHRRTLDRIVGPTRVVGRNAKFTVALSRARG